MVEIPSLLWEYLFIRIMNLHPLPTMLVVRAAPDLQARSCSYQNLINLWADLPQLLHFLATQELSTLRTFPQNPTLSGLLFASRSSGVSLSSFPYTRERSSSSPNLSYTLEIWEPMRARMGESSRSLRMSCKVTVGEQKASVRILSSMPGAVVLVLSKSSLSIAFAAGISFVILSSSQSMTDTVRRSRLNSK